MPRFFDRPQTTVFLPRVFIPFINQEKQNGKKVKFVLNSFMTSNSFHVAYISWSGCYVTVYDHVLLIKVDLLRIKILLHWWNLSENWYNNGWSIDRWHGQFWRGRVRRMGQFYWRFAWGHCEGSPSNFQTTGWRNGGGTMALTGIKKGGKLRGKQKRWVCICFVPVSCTSTSVQEWTRRKSGGGGEHCLKGCKCLHALLVWKHPW